MSARQRRLRTADLEERAWTLYVNAGKTQAQIAAELGVHQTTIGKAVRRVEERLQAEFKEARLRGRIHQLARLDHIYAEAIAAFTRSKLSQAASASWRPEALEVPPAERPGDPRFLNAAMTALAEKRKILGLDAPAQFQMVDTKRPYRDLSDAELERELWEGLAALGVKKKPDTDS